MDPLAQLADIHLPEPVSQAPIAPGWWLLYISVILTLVFFILKIIRHYRLTKVKRKLLKQLESNALNIQELVQVLKFASLHYFKREQVASLYGESWMAFLVNQLPEKLRAEFEQHGQSLAFNHYQAQMPQQSQCQQAQKAALLWLTNALPPNKKLSKLQAAPAASIKKESLT